MSDETKAAKLAQEVTNWFSDYLEKLEKIAPPEDAKLVKVSFLNSFLEAYNIRREVSKKNESFHDPAGYLYQLCITFFGTLDTKSAHPTNPLRAQKNEWYFLPKEIANKIGLIFAYADFTLPDQRFPENQEGIEKQTISSFNMMKRGLQNIGVPTHFFARHISETYKAHQEKISSKKKNLFAELEALFT